MPKTTPPQEPIRDQVLRIAAGIFAERGFIATMADDFFDAMNRRQQAELQKFQSRARLAQAVANKALVGLPLLPDKDRPDDVQGVARLVMMCREMAQALNHDVFARAAFRLLQEAHHIDAHLPKPIVGWVNIITGFFADAVEMGDLPADLNVQEAAWNTVVSFHGVKDACWVLDMNDQLPEKVETWLEYTLRSLGCSNISGFLARPAAG